MRGTLALRQVINDTLIELAATRPDIVVLTSDSRGSASATAFAKAFPNQFVEVGIAEQNIVGIAAGLAASGKTPFVMSPASFLSMRSIEQIKVDVAYSQANVKLIGVSGGVSYGALGMSHHSLQDIAVARAIPGLAVALPADEHDARNMIQTLVDGTGAAYIRIGRNPVPDVYERDVAPFTFGKAVTLVDGQDVTLIGTGETVRIVLDAAQALASDGIRCRVLNMHTIKPFDEDAVLRAARKTGHIITVEEHSIHGGLGAAVAEVVVQQSPVPMRIIGIRDEPAITGSPSEIFQHYGLSVDNICNVAKTILER